MAKKEPSKAYLRFETVISRSLEMLTLFTFVTKVQESLKPDSTLQLTDLCRTSVVLAVAAMDAYFTDVFIERLIPYLRKQKASKELAELLFDAGLDTSLALTLLVDKRPFGKIKRLVVKRLERKTTQTFEIIDELFKVYNFPSITDIAARKASRGKPDRLLRTIKRLVVRRHRIAHKGDLNSKGKLCEIQPIDTRRRIERLVAFVAAADEILHRLA